MTNQTALRQMIDQYFSESDLRALCFDLDVNYDENLRGSVKTEKILSLLRWCQQRGHGPKLIQLCQQERPHVNWPDWPQNDPGTGRTNVLTYRPDSTSSGQVDPIGEDLSPFDNPTEPISKVERNKSPGKPPAPIVKPIDRVLVSSIQEIVRYVMSQQNRYFNPHWFASRREAMETSFEAISHMTSHIDLLMQDPDMAETVAESCHQLSLQATELLKLLQQVGIGPRSANPKRALHNNLYLMDERAAKVERKLRQVIDNFYTDDLASNLPTELRIRLRELQAPTQYTLRWLNYAIERLDSQSPQ
jgi:hypothetical protein